MPKNLNDRILEAMVDVARTQVIPSDALCGKKFDTNKPDFSLLPPEALVEVVEILTFGKAKYGAHNWRAGFVWSRISAAVLRHLFAWIGGEDNDRESGKSHLAHAICGLLFLLTFSKTKTGVDDRYRPPTSECKE